jgi:hypothetical protein
LLVIFFSFLDIGMKYMDKEATIEGNIKGSKGKF